MNSEKDNLKSWNVVVRHKRRNSDKQVKQTEDKNVYQQQQRKIENLLQKMAKLSRENAELKTEVQITSDLLNQSTRKVETIEKKLLVDKKTMDDIQAIEVDTIKKSINFLKIFSSFVERDGFHVGLFGSLVRRVVEPRSRTIEEHEKFMSEFQKSDMDVCVYSCSNSVHPNLGKIVSKMKNFGIISELNIISYKQFMSPSGYHDDYTEHMKFDFKFKGEKIELDLFNRKPTSDFFGGRDFSCNTLEIDGHTGSLILPADFQKPFQMLDTLLEIGIKVTHPLFPVSGKVDSSFISRKVSKMIQRQKKLENNGYNISSKLIESTFSTSNEHCCVCYDTASDKINAGKEVPDHYMTGCLCSNGRNLCSECLEHLLNTRDFRCPGCRQPLQVQSEKDNENKENDELEVLIPEIVQLSISEANQGFREPNFDDDPIISSDDRNADINSYFSGHLAMPVYDNVWPPQR